jgi:CheY-like chemotaxis protein
LVVDDDCLQRERLSQVLRRIGETLVFEVASGDEALECLRTRPAEIGLVICDLQMPGMDGMALLRRVGECGHNPAVIISSAADPSIMSSVELMVKAVGLNVLGSLPKPVRSATMEKLLRVYRQMPASAGQAPTIDLKAADLDRAFANGEIVPYFQPKMDLATRRLAGAEALARWNHPLHGLLRPSEFLPLIEAQGELPQLTQAIIASSVKHAAIWNKRACGLMLNVNLSLSAM